ncbi:MAG: universal stress protein [Ilumatobacteraceae bacterium]
MDQKITVGYDSTESSVESVMWAAHEAGVRKLPLRIVSCFGMPVLTSAGPLGWGAGEAFDAERTAATQGLQEIRATVEAVHPDLSFTTELSSGPVEEVLLEGIGPHDLVVVGASSHPGAAAFWLGNTPRHLVRHSPCAIVVVRGPASRGGPDRVVVGIDGSATADRALRWAADEADLHHTGLLVVHTWSVPLGNDLETVRDLARIDAACALEAAVESARERCGATVESLLVETGPVEGLLDAVRDGDVLVLGSRGRGALRSGLFGSTVNGVLDAAAVPVVVVREEPSDDPGDTQGRSAGLASVG